VSPPYYLPAAYQLPEILKVISSAGKTNINLQPGKVAEEKGVEKSGFPCTTGSHDGKKLTGTNNPASWTSGIETWQLFFSCLPFLRICFGGFGSPFEGRIPQHLLLDPPGTSTHRFDQDKCDFLLS
jgi:hypothetical protein